MPDYSINILVQAKDEASKVLGGVGGALSSLGGIAVGGALAGAVALGAGLFKSVEAAAQAEEGQAQLAARIASTGGVAGVTAEMANELASSLQEVTRFEDDTVLSAENMLLTFTNIGKDVFPQATEMTLDMATAFKTDAVSAATMLGKALNNPIEGVGALSRVGVQFTKDQEAMIKGMVEAGDIAGAQKIILGELTHEIGGAAQAAGDTFSGKLDILQNKFGDVMETVGGALLPILSDGADALVGFLNNPQVQAAAGALAASIGDIASQAGDMLKSFASTDIGATVSNMFGGIGGALQSAGSSLVGWLSSDLAPALQSFGDTVATAAMPTLERLGEWIQSTLLPALQQLADWLGPRIQEALSALGSFITGQALPALGQFAAWIFSVGLPALGDFAGVVSGAVNGAIETLKKLWEGAAKAFSDAVDFIKAAQGALQTFADAVSGTIASALQAFTDNVLTPIRDAFDAVAGAIQDVVDWLNELASMFGFEIGSGAFADFLSSLGIQGFAAGGAAQANVPIMVGESGSEIFVPRTSGTIIPHSALTSGSGLGVGTTIIIDVQGDVIVDSARRVDEWAERIAELLRAAEARGVA